MSEVGIPYDLCMKMTYREIVNSHNIDDLTQRVHNGPGYLHGAQTVIMDDNTVIHLDSVPDRSQINLKIGWAVERHLKKGDLVTMNRQPSLRRVSMMRHKVVPLPGKTFRLNLSVCAPYNADFDGDEMNLGVVQNELARAEKDVLMAVEQHIVTGQSNKPVMGVVQDALSGSFFLSRKNSMFTRDDMMQLMMQIEHSPIDLRNLPAPAVFKPVPMWTGKQVFSMIVPKNISLERDIRDLKANKLDKNKKEIDQSKYKWIEEIEDERLKQLTLDAVQDVVMDADERRVVIRNGELLSGTLCKQSLGATAGGLIHIMYRDCGPQRTSDFISDTQYIANYFLLMRGLSVGVADVMIREETKQRVQNLVNRAVTAVDEAMSQKLEGVSAMEVEQHASKITNQVLDYAGRIVQEETNVDNNTIFAMALCASKGTPINTSQIRGCIGQQSNEGQRIHSNNKHGIDGGRTLPSFAAGEKSALSRGFVGTNYRDGASPQEFFFMMVSGREGVIDTAVKTAETGYVQRRLVKAQEDLLVSYDGTVRNANNEIVEFAYGSDGMDPARIEKVICNELLWDNEKLWQTYVEPFAANQYQRDKLEDELKRIIAVRDVLRKSHTTVLQPELQNHLFVPVNMYRLVDRFVQEEKLKRAPIPMGQKRLNNPSVLIPCVNKLLDSLKKEAHERFEHPSFELHARLALAPVRLLHMDPNFDLESMELLTQKVEREYLSSFVAPGEMVGVIGAESIGEPSTQMTLNTFHFSGIASKNVTLGVPRLKELVDVTKNIKKPVMTIWLKKPFSNSQESANIACRMMEQVQLSDVVKAVHIVKRSEMPVELSFLDSMSQIFNGSQMNPDNYCMIFDLDRSLIMEHGLTPRDVKQAIERSLGQKRVIVESSEYNMKRWSVVVHSHQVNTALAQVTNNNENIKRTVARGLLSRLSEYLKENVRIKGVQQLKRCRPSSVSTTEYDAQTGSVRSVPKFVVDAEGTNLRSILSLPCVDSDRTYCNDVHEISQVLGIQAASLVLYHELKAVLSFDGTYINDRHLMLAVHAITHEGFLMPMTRHGINRQGKIGFLARSSFEETVDVFCQAAAFAESDNMDGVTQNIMFGQTTPLGTGVFHILSEKKPEAKNKHKITNPWESMLTRKRSRPVDEQQQYFEERKAKRSRMQPEEYEPMYANESAYYTDEQAAAYADESAYNPYAQYAQVQPVLQNPMVEPVRLQAQDHQNNSPSSASMDVLRLDNDNELLALLDSFAANSNEHADSVTPMSEQQPIQESSDSSQIQSTWDMPQMNGEVATMAMQQFQQHYNHHHNHQQVQYCPSSPSGHSWSPIVHAEENMSDVLVDVESMPIVYDSNVYDIYNNMQM